MIFKKLFSLLVVVVKLLNCCWCILCLDVLARRGAGAGLAPVVVGGRTGCEPTVAMNPFGLDGRHTGLGAPNGLVMIMADDG